MADLCGTPCQEVVDTSGVERVCSITWADGCGDAPPPPGFTAESTVAELCYRACAFYNWQQQEAASQATKRTGTAPNG